MSKKFLTIMVERIFIDAHKSHSVYNRKSVIHVSAFQTALALFNIHQYSMYNPAPKNFVTFAYVRSHSRRDHEEMDKGEEEKGDYTHRKIRRNSCSDDSSVAWLQQAAGRRKSDEKRAWRLWGRVQSLLE